jgi:hypothetical protein
MEKLLEKAKHDNVITQFDTGRGLILWFAGAPGRKLRQLRNTIRAKLPNDWITVLRTKRNVKK